MPPFLENVVSPEAYERWINRRAIAHVKRDRKRGHLTATRALYKESIHAAVILSAGKDFYTGEKLHWQLISKYDNSESKKGKHGYKSGFALLPTVDHVNAEATEASFRICAWRTNDAKNDLSHELLIELCVKVLNHSGYKVERRA
jgi:hypothetical protein